MGKPKILIVDDSSVTLLITKGVLGNGFEIQTTRDGKTALGLVESFGPDLILLDIVMPGISGLEVCKTISNSDKFSDIPIILVTSLTDAGEIKKGLDSGAVDYITKPFKQVELSARINAALRLRHHTQMIQQNKEIIEDS